MKTKIRLLSVLLFLPFLFGQPAHAAPPQWAIQKASSQIAFDGLQENAPFHGYFRDFSGTIAFDPADLAASKADITIPLASIEGGSADRNKYLRTTDWLDIAAYPTARFTTNKIEKGLAENQYVAKGILSLRGVSLPVELPFTLTIKKDKTGATLAVMHGKTSINRLAFGVGQGEWKDTRTIADKIAISVSLTAQKETQTETGKKP